MLHDVLFEWCIASYLDTYDMYREIWCDIKSFGMMVICQSHCMKTQTL